MDFEERGGPDATSEGVGRRAGLMIHPCGPDTYKGSAQLLSDAAFVQQWEVTGPRKQGSISTRFAKQGSAAAAASAQPGTRVDGGSGHQEGEGKPAAEGAGGLYACYLLASSNGSRTYCGITTGKCAGSKGPPAHARALLFRRRRQASVGARAKIASQGGGGCMLPVPTAPYVLQMMP